MKAKLILAAALSLAAACSTAPAGETGPAPSSGATASAAVNPVGRYEFTTDVQGQSVNGTVVIAGNPGAYTGQVTTSITPPLPISGVTVNGREVVVVGTGPDGGTLTFRMNFTDATNFNGNWEVGGDTGTLTGRRVS